MAICLRCETSGNWVALGLLTAVFHLLTVTKFLYLRFNDLRVQFYHVLEQDNLIMNESYLVHGAL
jgi:hypothetical protein